MECSEAVIVVVVGENVKVHKRRQLSERANIITSQLRVCMFYYTCITSNVRRRENENCHPQEKVVKNI